MLISYAPDKSDAFYKVMIQAIVPRPIAWVLSRNANDSLNAAPFSFFTGVASEPPILMLSVGWKDDDTRKDTWVNIEERNDFVVHIPSLSQATSLVATSKSLPSTESEVDFAGLKTVPMEGLPLPRIDGPKIAMFCQKHKIIEVADERQGLILGEIKNLWLDDDAASLKEGQTILDPKQLNPLARLGGKDYGALGEVFQVERPK